ncbi:hypothetical protein [Sabulicella glaciei]|uniref:DAK2 domain-containing protein n=1 Tax=Sabulicella glaciei TaxID=2984948 RepID=A0ABT3NU81_9PROT|nr:hypothetical protein [Roseococcus sp. MDT2-1-1]MCW8085716.1 hypothetical protein [Roseococcus sp. MDT2-1-1]
MSTNSEQRLFDALATITRAFADGGVPTMLGADAAGNDAADGSSPAIAVMDDEAREVLGEAALAVAFGAFASRGGDGGTIQTLIASLGLMAILAGEDPDPPAEIMGIAAGDDQVEAEIDRAGEALDDTHGPDASAEEVVGALEARILGTAITLAGCTLPDGVKGQHAVRLRAARCLVRLATGLIAMNVASAAESGATAADAGLLDPSSGNSGG